MLAGSRRAPSRMEGRRTENIATPPRRWIPSRCLISFFLSFFFFWKLPSPSPRRLKIVRLNRRRGRRSDHHFPRPLIFLLSCRCFLFLPPPPLLLLLLSFLCSATEVRPRREGRSIRFGDKQADRKPPRGNKSSLASIVSFRPNPPPRFPPLPCQNSTFGFSFGNPTTRRDSSWRKRLLWHESQWTPSLLFPPPSIARRGGRASDKRGVLNRRFSGLSGVVIRSQWVTDLEQWGRECRLIGVSTLETFSISIDPVPLCSPLLLILTREEESNYRIREFERRKSRLHSMRREGKKIIYIR